MTRRSEDSAGPGEAAERRRRTAFQRLYAGLFVVGFLAGLGLGVAEPEGSAIGDGGTVDPIIAALIAAVAIAAMVWGSLRATRQFDEFERLENLRAGAFSSAMMLGSYPVWLILWKGGLLPAPEAVGLFAIGFASMLGHLAVRQLRLR